MPESQAVRYLVSAGVVDDELVAATVELVGGAGVVLELEVITVVVGARVVLLDVVGAGVVELDVVGDAVVELLVVGHGMFGSGVINPNL